MAGDCLALDWVVCLVIRGLSVVIQLEDWIPVFAGMTMGERGGRIINGDRYSMESFV
ncbi:hypothetical protein C8R32_106226 [Nitrosospira sp. Nsp5]|uniref:Uncharacterized protein n=1 Tax=Nitrosospira multiformis TaxID=1231 RepID=A0ABY0TBS0_9PROT|nr:hypothetical protein C8R32_106226 [Nitrosospira sp. Nsp5]SDQ50181.1 hypothetical protein SAMN05216402_1102 [Nitrosospira multiformis]